MKKFKFLLGGVGLIPIITTPLLISATPENGENASNEASGTNEEHTEATSSDDTNNNSLYDETKVISEKFSGIYNYLLNYLNYYKTLDVSTSNFLFDNREKINSLTNLSEAQKAFYLNLINGIENSNENKKNYIKYFLSSLAFMVDNSSKFFNYDNYISSELDNLNKKKRSAIDALNFFQKIKSKEKFNDFIRDKSIWIGNYYDFMRIGNNYDMDIDSYYDYYEDFFNLITSTLNQKGEVEEDFDNHRHMPQIHKYIKYKGEKIFLSSYQNYYLSEDNDTKYDNFVTNIENDINKEINELTSQIKRISDKSILDTLIAELQRDKYQNIINSDRQAKTYYDSVLFYYNQIRNYNSNSEKDRIKNVLTNNIIYKNFSFHIENFNLSKISENKDIFTYTPEYKFILALKDLVNLVDFEDKKQNNLEYITSQSIKYIDRLDIEESSNYTRKTDYKREIDKITTNENTELSTRKIYIHPDLGGYVYETTKTKIINNKTDEEKIAGIKEIILRAHREDYNLRLKYWFLIMNQKYTSKEVSYAKVLEYQQKLLDISYNEDELWEKIVNSNFTYTFENELLNLMEEFYNEVSKTTYDKNYVINDGNIYYGDVLNINRIIYKTDVNFNEYYNNILNGDGDNYQRKNIKSYLVYKTKEYKENIKNNYLKILSYIYQSVDNYYLSRIQEFKFKLDEFWKTEESLKLLIESDEEIKNHINNQTIISFILKEEEIKRINNRVYIGVETNYFINQFLYLNLYGEDFSDYQAKRHLWNGYFFTIIKNYLEYSNTTIRKPYEINKILLYLKNNPNYGYSDYYIHTEFEKFYNKEILKQNFPNLDFDKIFEKIDENFSYLYGNATEKELLYFKALIMINTLNYNYYVKSQEDYFVREKNIFNVDYKNWWDFKDNVFDKNTTYYSKNLEIRDKYVSYKEKYKPILDKLYERTANIYHFNEVKENNLEFSNEEWEAIDRLFKMAFLETTNTQNVFLPILKQLNFFNPDIDNIYEVRVERINYNYYLTIKFQPLEYFQRHLEFNENSYKDILNYVKYKYNGRFDNDSSTDMEEERLIQYAKYHYTHELLILVKGFLENITFFDSIFIDYISNNTKQFNYLDFYNSPAYYVHFYKFPNLSHDYSKIIENEINNELASYEQFWEIYKNTILYYNFRNNKIGFNTQVLDKRREDFDNKFNDTIGNIYTDFIPKDSLYLMFDNLLESIKKVKELNVNNYKNYYEFQDNREREAELAKAVDEYLRVFYNIPNELKVFALRLPLDVFIFNYDENNDVPNNLKVVENKINLIKEYIDSLEYKAPNPPSIADEIIDIENNTRTIGIGTESEPNDEAREEYEIPKEELVKGTSSETTMDDFEEYLRENGYLDEEDNIHIDTNNFNISNGNISNIKEFLKELINNYNLPNYDINNNDFNTKKGNLNLSLANIKRDLITKLESVSSGDELKEFLVVYDKANKNEIKTLIKEDEILRVLVSYSNDNLIEESTLRKIVDTENLSDIPSLLINIINNKNEALASLKETNDNKDREIERLNTLITSLEANKNNLSEKISEFETILNDFNHLVHNLENSNKDNFNNILATSPSILKEAIIKILEAKERALNEEKILADITLKDKLIASPISKLVGATYQGNTTEEHLEELLAKSEKKLIDIIAKYEAQLAKNKTLESENNSFRVKNKNLTILLAITISLLTVITGILVLLLIRKRKEIDKKERES